ncbi:MAG TPA: hypothetical protein H9681_06805 [Firmicutes bacterium]|nr:hypothetical protein [Bacillota bacterium]
MEKIYTIPVNEAFEASAADPACGCPFCTLYSKLEENELDLILGASMMEPDVRIKTNELGFCKTHYDMMFTRKNRLGLALMLESHLNELRREVDSGGLSLMKSPGTDQMKRLERLEHDCYVCGRIEFSLSKMFETAVLLWERDPEFRKKLSAQPYICLVHYRKYIEFGRRALPKKLFSEFYREVSGVVLSYFDTLREDVSWFCKKFDYRYNDEPWYNSKDAVERAIKFLSGGGDTPAGGGDAPRQ